MRMRTLLVVGVALATCVSARAGEPAPPSLEGKTVDRGTALLLPAASTAGLPTVPVIATRTITAADGSGPEVTDLASVDVDVEADSISLVFLGDPVYPEELFDGIVIETDSTVSDFDVEILPTTTMPDADPARVRFGTNAGVQFVAVDLAGIGGRFGSAQGTRLDLGITPTGFQQPSFDGEELTVYHAEASLDEGAFGAYQDATEIGPGVEFPNADGALAQVDFDGNLVTIDFEPVLNVPAWIALGDRLRLHLDPDPPLEDVVLLSSTNPGFDQTRIRHDDDEIHLETSGFHFDPGDRVALWITNYAPEPGGAAGSLLAVAAVAALRRGVGAEARRSSACPKRGSPRRSTSSPMAPRV